jgi:hypothetical protein
MTNELQLKSALLRLFLCLSVYSTGFVGAFLTASPAKAEDAPPSETWEQKAIDSNIKVSRWFDSVAEFIDLFVAGRRVTTRRNETNVRIENASVYKEGVGYTNSNAFNLNLRLPNVEEYWNLKFTSYDEEADRRTSENAQYRQRPRDQNYGATIGFFRKLGNIRAAFQPRIELQNPLKVSHTMTLDTTSNIGEIAQVNPKIELFAGSDRGTGIFDQLNFGVQLNHIYSLSIVNQSTYEDKTHKFIVAQGFAVGRQVIKNGGIAYSIFFNSDNVPNYHLASYSVATTWTQLIYSKILDYNVSPHVDFAKENAFTGRFGLNFNVNLTF